MTEITETDHDATNHIYKAAQDLETLDPQFIDVVEAYHEYEHHDEGDLPRYRVHVVIQDSSERPVSNGSYCYPIANVARDEWGLYLFDTVTNWEDEQIILRFGYDPE